MHTNLLFIFSQVFSDKCDAKCNRLLSSIWQVILLDSNLFLLLVNLTLGKGAPGALNWQLFVNLISPEYSLELVLVEYLAGAFKSLLGHHYW